MGNKKKRKIAEILNGKVWRTFETNMPPGVSAVENPALFFVDVTDLPAVPEDGWVYENGTFTAPSLAVKAAEFHPKMLRALKDEEWRMRRAQCNFMLGTLDGKDRGYLAWVVKMMDLVETPEFEAGTVTGVSLEEELAKAGK